jgi:hypothetical protein
MGMFVIVTLSVLELADMLESYIQALNTKGYIPDYQSAWELTVKIAYERAGKFGHEYF